MSRIDDAALLRQRRDAAAEVALQNPPPSSSSDDDNTEQAIGAAFDPDWLLATNTFLPWHANQIRRSWVPRVVGRVTSSGSSPDAFEPAAGWLPYGAPVRMESGRSIAQWSHEPRLAFIDGWGSGNNKLFGTYLVTYHRMSNLVKYVAVRKIVPSSDFSDNPNGVSDVIFEELAKNVHWIPAAVGSLNLSGDELVLFMHFNDDGHYRTESVSASMIDQWQQHILARQTAGDANEAMITDDASRNAQRRYWQVVLAVKNAAQSDEKFSKLTQSVPQLKTLWNEGRVIPDDDAAVYYPDYSASK